MTPATTDRLWAQAQLALDQRRVPLDDAALLAALEATLDAPPDPKLDAALRASIAELAALEAALDELEPASSIWEPPRAPSAVGPRLARASAAAVLLVAALLFNRNKPSAPPAQLLDSTSSAAPVMAAKGAASQPPRATFQRLDVSIERKSAPIRLASQSLQVTTTRSLHRPR